MYRLSIVYPNPKDDRTHNVTYCDLQDKLSVYMYIKCLNNESLCLGTIYYSLLDKPSVI